ncbi:hypothetical protein L0P88_05935 [Muricauda sp. SCSIO 64092]|uniref:M56 family metallopeptidase n=1 Tax=Allomuricauda sp. SCSIO 64092 TaxID=2908842 RepID=UPI001FF2439D|nr:M56 family metallopeptidase [Muricauda sp. SCSIO 64092]UOY08093.1 hypothetical protein L0P88_05935 [Muricauda sp. SCSIO 64092]
MLVYLLKSTACMAILFLFYKLFLERENMHVFKRFFLTGSLVVSLLIPLLVFTEYVEAIPMGTNTATDADSLIFSEQGNADMAMVNWEMLLWNLYSVGCLVVGFRFAKHLYQIVRRIQKNPKHNVNFSTRVLLNEKMPPHTFLNYIFLNKKELENGTIPREVILHEETHAKQYHSLDVLFIELLQVVFWFNPLLVLFKKSIKLNHEFLADSAVLNQRISTKKYQNTLLSYLSSDSLEKYRSIKVANAINYSSIKKRFTVMGKQTSKKSVVFRGLLLIPLVALMLFGFSDKKEVIKTSNSQFIENPDYSARSISIDILDDGNYLVEGFKASKNNFVEVINTFHKDIPPGIRNKVLNIHLKSSKEISKQEVWFVYNSLLEYGFYRLVTDDQEIIREKGNKPLAIENTYNQNKGASREQMREYNALAKKYNTMPRDNMHILKKEVERMTYLYSLMSDKQRADTEPFPNFPEPPRPPGPNGIEEVPPPPPPVKAPNMKEVKEVPPPPAPKSPLEHIKEVAEKGAIFYYEGKRIDANKAIQLLENNTDLNITTNHTNDEDYVVTISRSSKVTY